MTDTTTLAPTDAEIDAEWLVATKAMRGYTRDLVRHFARAVLAKWGAPAPASDALRTAAEALVDRWDTPHWKITEHTGVYIDSLRKALAAPPAQEARVPLSDYLANDVVDSLGWELDDDEKDDMVRVVRATEGAHGITAAQKETPND